jgi:hypothetical protein
MARDSYKRQKPLDVPITGQSDRHSNLREEIAYRAARLVAEDGLTDLAAAKQKAARQMGVTEKGLLPDNREIEAALRTHLSLFQCDTQPRECRALRQIAVDVMRRLQLFSPWLVGSVLSGTANRFSPIELEIVTDDAKQLEMFFLNQGLPFETRAARVSPTAHDSDQISRYELSVMETPVLISLYPHHAVRFSHRPRENLAHARAQLKDVELLLA